MLDVRLTNISFPCRFVARTIADLETNSWNSGACVRISWHIAANISRNESRNGGGEGRYPKSNILEQTIALANKYSKLLKWMMYLTGRSKMPPHLTPFELM